MLRGPLWGVSLGLALTGCKEATPDRSQARKTDPEAPADAAPAPDSAAQPVRVAPKDLDVEALRSKLKCSRSRSEACRVLAEFSNAKTFSWQTPAGEGRWVGHAYLVGKDEEAKDFMVLWVKQVPTATVDRDLLPIKLGTGMLPENLLDNRWKLVHAMKTNSAVSRRNRAHPVAVEFVPTEQHGATRTEGASIGSFTSEKAFIRQSGRAVYYVRPSSDPAASKGEGTYAELWPVSW